MAIAFDSATNPVYAATAVRTLNHTCSGSDRILWVQTWRRGGDDVTVTYAGVSMTNIGAEIIASNAGGGDEYIQMWYLAGPATGTNAITVTSAGATEHIDSGVSYTGASQTGIPDATSSLAITTQANTTATVTTVADNSWAILFLRCGSTGQSTAGSGTIRRANFNGYHQVYDGDGAKTPAGSYSLNTTHTSQQTGFWMASFAPASAAVLTNNLMMLGVGV